MIQNPLLNAEFLALLDAAEPDHQKIRAAIIRAYSNVTGDNLDEAITP